MAKSGKINSAALGALTGGQQTQEYQKGPETPFQNPFDIIADKMKNSTEYDPEFTGIARSVICIHNQGFNNFQICTLYIEKGKVVKMDKSDMWASFECFAFLEMISKRSCDNLNNNFKDGMAFQK